MLHLMAVASSSAFVLPAQPAGLAGRAMPAMLFGKEDKKPSEGGLSFPELPSFLPKLELLELPELPSVLQFQPRAARKNTCEFDEYGRMIKGPKVPKNQKQKKLDEDIVRRRQARTRAAPRPLLLASLHAPSFSLPIRVTSTLATAA